MDALDACHFNVRRGAGPEIQVTSAGGCCAAGEVLGQGFHHLAGAQDARCQSGSRVMHAPAFGGGVMQHDGAGIGDAAKARCDHAFGLLDLRGRQAVVDLPVETRRPATPAGVRRAQQSCACRWPASWAAIAAGSSSGAHSTTSASYSRRRSIISSTQARRLSASRAGCSRAATPA